MYYYEKDVLKFSDVFIGYIAAAGGIGFMVGTVFFSSLARRITYDKLLRLIVITGAGSTLLYVFFRDARSALIITVVTALVGVITFLGTLTIAAKACPKYAEGTVFALLMSVFNVGSQVGDIIGSKLYPYLGYSWLVVISAAFTAAMWFFLPLVKEKSPLS
jgi:predicted MFS family arabinose efflux permease